MGSVYFFSYFLRSAIPGTIFDDLQTDLGLSASAVAAMGSMFTWIYGGMQIVVGLLAARYAGRARWSGRRGVLAGGRVSLSRSAGPAFASRAVTWLGASFMYLCLIKELDRLFDQRRFTLWLGIILAVGYSGGVMATLPFERLADAFGWRRTLLAAAVLLAAALAVAGSALRWLGAGSQVPQPLSPRSLTEVLQNRRIRPLCICSLVAFPSVFTLQTVLGKNSSRISAGCVRSGAAACILAHDRHQRMQRGAGWQSMPRLFNERRAR